MAKYTRDRSKTISSRAKDYRSTQMEVDSKVILLMESNTAREFTNGATEKYMTVSGSMVVKMVVVCGKESTEIAI